MKKLLQLFLFLAFGTMLHAQNNCGVSVSMDSTNTGDVVAVAYPTGTAPFTFAWSTGDNTPITVITAWGINYCVTITDATGCTAVGCLFSQTCSATVFSSPAWDYLYASANGVPNFTYQWSNGDTTAFTYPATNGTYCVTITDATGCTSTDCEDYNGAGSGNDCDAIIYADSSNTGNAVLTVSSWGTAPFAYIWTTGEATPTIYTAASGTYCVTVTDATGCSASDCWTVASDPCNVTIVANNTPGVDYLVATVNGQNFTFLWNTGETTQVIEPTSSGTYCVTITGNGCTGMGCYYYYAGNEINGSVSLQDSITPAVLEGTVDLFLYDAANNAWNLVNTVPIQSDPAGYYNTYDFGVVAAGQYLVRASLDPASPYFADVLPTYHFNSILWDEANVITIPSNWQGFTIILDDGQLLPGGGTGEIFGTVTEGDGFTANGGDNRGGTPLEGVSVILYDEQENPITHQLTNADGIYTFDHLPFGTYKVLAEITGKEQAERWVTLSADQPSSSGNDFEVSESGIVLGLADLLANSGLEVSPNPTTGNLNVWVESTAHFEATLRLTRADGSVVLLENQVITKGGQFLHLDVAAVPSGLYFLQLATGQQVVTAKVVKQ